jgi:hypothetical protein
MPLVEVDAPPGECIHPSVWKVNSRNFPCTGFSEVAQLGAHQATHHPYHQLHGPTLAQLLVAYQCVPRLKVLG